MPFAQGLAAGIIIPDRIVAEVVAVTTTIAMRGIFILPAHKQKAVAATHDAAQFDLRASLPPLYVTRHL
jgi:hypothetical protein